MTETPAQAAEAGALVPLEKEVVPMETEMMPLPPLEDNRLHPFIEKNIEFLAIMFFEYTGALLFAYSICMSSLYTINPDKVNAGSFFVEYGLLIAAFWGGEFTGAHFNYAITVGYFFKRGSNFTYQKLIVYPIFSLLGSFTGGMLAWLLEDKVKAPQPKSVGDELIRDFFAEIFATYCYAFFKIWTMVKGQWPVNNRLLTIVLLAIMFFICRAFAFKTQCINPTNALALGLVLTLKTRNYTYWPNIWIFIVGPITGSVLAALTLDHIYLPLMREKQEDKKN